MKAVLISINPKWCELIASGKKTIELRKTAPKLEMPFKCYIYETRGFSSYYIEKNNTRNIGSFSKTRVGGKVIGEFVCDKIYKIYTYQEVDNSLCAYSNEMVDDGIDLEENSCLSEDRITSYLGRCGYAWHISDLKIYDKPKELGGFRKTCKVTAKIPCSGCGDANTYMERCERPYIARPPQSWCYVEVL